MGLFSTQEERDAIKQEKLKNALAKYGMENLSDERDLASIQTIITETLGYKWFDAASLLGNDSSTLRMIAESNRVIMEQNFIMIRQLDRISKEKDTYIYSQTTKSLEGYKRIVAAIKESLADGKECESFNTVCGQVANRMNGIGEFASSHELIFFVCGSKSSNGKILFNECKRMNPRSYQIEGPEDIDLTLTEGVNSIGICGATSTPKWLMENCKQAIINYHNDK